jgi:AAA family ATP:ADP antiporter
VPSSRSLARLANRVLAGATDIRPGEGRSVVASGLLFFLILTAIMALRPVREAMGLEHGLKQLRRLFFVTVAATLLLAPAFGYLVSRLPRRQFLAVSFRVCSLVLVGFFLMRVLLPQHIGGTSGAVYYVYHSVFNLFVVSVFWALMADLFSLAESKRLFPAIAVGGTLGAVAGPVISGRLAPRLGVASLFLVAAGLLEAAVWAAGWVARTRAARAPSAGDERRIGGRSWAGITRFLRSPYMWGIALFFLLTAVVSTFLYFTELGLVGEATESTRQRTALFANILALTQLATLVAQAFIAGRIMRFLGVGTALGLLPVVSAVGFGVLARKPTLALYTLVNAAAKAVQRGITRPARETLFTVVDREAKYKTKTFLDTFVFRTGDASGAQLEGPLAAWGRDVLGHAVAGLARAVLPIAAVWAVLSLVLGAAQSRLAAAKRPDEKSRPVNTEVAEAPPGRTGG